MGMLTGQQRLLFLLFSTSSLFENTQSLNTACYRLVAGIEHASHNGGPCGVVSDNSPFYSCCAIDDQCLEGGLCHNPNANTSSKDVSGYYVGGCNDPQLKDAACNAGCTTLGQADIVFNRTQQAWRCCGGVAGVPKCNNPTTQIVAAKALPDIATTYVVPSQVATSSVSVSHVPTSTPISSAKPTITGHNSNSSGTSSNAGAIAGGVVGGLAGLALIASGAWFFLRRRKRNKKMRAAGIDEGETPSLDGLLKRPVEKEPDAERIELQAQQRPSELSAQLDLGGNKTTELMELPT